MKFVSRFNPHDMVAEQVRALATGREAQLKHVLEIIDSNLTAKGSRQHILVTGPRGMGKSFFLRHLQVTLEDRNDPAIQMILLPEEQPFFSCPADFLSTICSKLVGRAMTGDMPQWQADASWDQAERELLSAMDKALPPGGLLVVAVENLDVALEKVFKNAADQSRLRDFLTRKLPIMLVASTLRQDLDQNYDKRMFQTFFRMPLPAWTEAEYVSYFQRRRKSADKKNDDGDEKVVKRRVRAIAKFAGGSPRIAVVLADLMDQDGPLDSAETLDGLVDELTPYYQDLMDKAPPRSTLLLDALIRGGEPCSQTDLAKRVGANQSEIAKAFAWLVDYGYVRAVAVKGRRAKQFMTSDRLFAQFYRKRYLHHGSGFSALAAMIDLLAEFYTYAELREHTLSLRGGHNQTYAEDMARAALAGMGIDKDYLEHHGQGNCIRAVELIIGDQSDDLNPEDFDDTNFKAFEGSEEEADAALLNFLDLLRNKSSVAPKLSGKLMANLLGRHSGLPTMQKIAIAKGIIAKRISEPLILEFQKIFISNKYQNKAQNLFDLKDFEKALPIFRKALELYEGFGDEKMIAWFLFKIGFCLFELERLDDSLMTFQKAQKTYEKQDDINIQLASLGGMGMVLARLGKFDEAVPLLKKVQVWFEKNNKFKENAAFLELIGTCMFELKRFDEALKVHRQVFDLSITTIDVEKQERSLGRMVRIYWMQGKQAQAWQLLEDEKFEGDANYRPLKGMSEYVVDQFKIGQAEAFKAGVEILDGLKERSKRWDIHQAWRAMCVGFINSELPPALIRDLCAEACTDSNDEMKLICDVIEKTLDFVEAGREPSILAEFDPDVAIAVQAIVDEAKL